ncbi:hypothetical protein BDN72DRAFT_769968, partial [Pluteus cervinus]
MNFNINATALPTYAAVSPLSSPPAPFVVVESPGCSCQGTSTRTLVAIVQSCLLTTAACVYRSIHPNILDPKSGYARVLRYRAAITFYMILFPELIIYWAMQQLLGARKVARDFNDLQIRMKWTTIHGHIAQMGGFGRDGTSVVFTPEELLEAAKTGMVDPEQLKIPVQDLEDHSKGDILSKGLLTLQTSWFVVQCVARLVQRLVLTELEVVTLAFAVLNIITYLFWWSKPLNVRSIRYLK